MYYVTTEKEDYTIITSYATDKQARQYGGIPEGKELHLHGENAEEGFTVHEYSPDVMDAGRVRTIFKSKMDASKAGKFLLYLQDERGRWKYSGISFATYSLANQAVKTSLSKTFGDMLIVEGGDPSLVEDQFD